MATAHRFLGIDDDIGLVLRWFEDCGQPYRRSDRTEAVVLLFFEMGPLVEGVEGRTIQDRSPIVWILKPKLTRRSLWTSGEVIFTPTPLKETFPVLQKINHRLSKWFQQFPLVYSNKSPEDSEWAYYLEGSIKNFDGPLFALPAADAKLRQGQYFVNHTDTTDFLDRICRYLRHRGVDVDISG